MPSSAPDRRSCARSTARLPASAADGAAGRDFGVYVHVPFCRVRCGYCDFNTYTSSELRGATPGAYADQAVAEIRFAAGVLSAIERRPASTVFFGGGTPTLLPPRRPGRHARGDRARVGSRTRAPR